MGPWDLAEGEVTIEVEAVGLCQRDSGIWNGDIDRPFPTVVGHEVVGRVIKSPAQLGWARGTRVAGMGNHALARHARVPAWQVAPVTGKGAHLTLVEPLACAVNAVGQDPSAADSVAVVFGLGLLGQLIAALHIASGRPVIGIDSDPARLALANTAGATVELSSDVTAVDRAIANAGSAYECTADPAVLLRVSSALPPGAGLILVAHHRRGDTRAGLLLDLWHQRGIAIRNAVPRTASNMAECVRAAAGLPIDLTRYRVSTGTLTDSPDLLESWPTGEVLRHVVVL